MIQGGGPDNFPTRVGQHLSWPDIWGRTLEKYLMDTTSILGVEMERVGHFLSLD